MQIEKSGDLPEQESSVPIFIRVFDDVSKEVLEGYVDIVEDWVYSREEELGFESVYSWYSERGFCMTRVYLPEAAANPKSIERLRSQLSLALPEIAGVKLEEGDPLDKIPWPLARKEIDTLREHGAHIVVSDLGELLT